MLSRAVLLGALILAPACFTSTPGMIRAAPEEPIVAIGAGRLSLGTGKLEGAWYLVDRKTQTCWFTNTTAMAPLDCCALRRVTEARPYLTWGSCPDDAAAPAPDAH